MIETEGVIKFSLEHEHTVAIDRPVVAVLNHWRNVLVGLGLVGAHPDRYGGLGFGNISGRLQGEEFVITGTQTGLLWELTARHYAHVTGSSQESNKVRSRGPRAPSSEALTHAAIYAAHWDIRFVFHCHSPEIWAAAARLGIPVTPEQLNYGTPELAAEAGQLVSGFTRGSAGLFAMGGHQDGVVAYATTANAAGNVLVSAQAAARNECNSGESIG